MSFVRTRNTFALLITVLCLMVSMFMLPSAAHAVGPGTIQINTSTHQTDVVYSGTMIADVDGTPIESALDWDQVRADSRFSGLEGVQLCEAVGTVAASDAEGTFVSQLADWVSGTPTLSVNCDGPAVEAAAGWYLLIPANDALRPLLAWVNDNDVVMGNKMDVPTLSKQVSSPSVGFGDEVNYTLSVTIPSTFDLYPVYKITLDDKWDEHLSLVADTLRITLKSGDVETDITDTAKTVVEDNTLEVIFDDLKTTPAKIGDSILLSYALAYTIPTQTDSLVLSNVAYLLYPEGEGEQETPPVEAQVYTFHIKVNKTDDSGTPLAGAVFGLKDEAGNWLSSDGSFGPAGDRMEFTSDSAGMITEVPALKAGTYTLTEIKAPDGYVFPSDPDSKIVLAATAENHTYSMNAEARGLAKVISLDTATGTVLLGVSNTLESASNPIAKALSTATRLSKTGDSIYPLIVATGLLLIAVAIIIIARRKSHHKETE